MTGAKQPETGFVEANETRLYYPRDAQRDMHSAELTRDHASWLSSFL